MDDKNLYFILDRINYVDIIQNVITSKRLKSINNIKYNFRWMKCDERRGDAATAKPYVHRNLHPHLLAPFNH